MSVTAGDVVRLMFAAHEIPMPDKNGVVPEVPVDFDVLSLFSDDFVVTCTPWTAVPGISRGRTAFFDTGAVLTRKFKIGTNQPALFDAGDVAIFTGVNRFESLASGEAVDMPCCEVYFAKDGKIVKLDCHFGETARLDAIARREFVGG